MRKNEKWKDGKLISSVEVPYTDSEIISALEDRRDYVASHYPYKGVLLRLESGKAMTQLSTLYLLCLANPSIPDNQVMADWQEGEGDIQITAGDLRGDGADILGNFQKAWSVFKVLKGNSYDSPDGAIEAFNQAMEE